MMILIFVTCLSLWATETTQKVALSCMPGESENSLQCTLKNHLDEKVWVLMAPFALEGPLGGRRCIYFATGGDRYENTLEYGFPSVGKLGGNILFKPYIRIDSIALERLVSVNPGNSLSFVITLDSVPSRYFENHPTWLFRAKVVFARDSNLTELRESGTIDQTCSDQIDSKISVSTTSPGQLAIRLRKPYEGSNDIDDCFDRITIQFDYVYSEDVLAGFPGMGLRSEKGKDSVCTSDQFFDLEPDQLKRTPTTQ